MVIQIPIDLAKVEQFSRRHHIRKLALFGSVLRDDFRAQSDVDILVKFDPEHIPGFDFIDVQRDLSDLLGRRVDLSTPGFLSPYIRERIQEEALVLYDAAG